MYLPLYDPFVKGFKRHERDPSEANMDGGLECEQREWAELWIHCLQVDLYSIADEYKWAELWLHCLQVALKQMNKNWFHALHRKEVTLHVGSVLKIRGHPRDLVQVDRVV